MPRQMTEHQSIFYRTGGTHTAAIFNGAGSIVSLAEDIGRHNAMDKAIGKLMLAGERVQGLGVALSGRVSLEIIIKAARAGLELISAVSAPTSMAASMAEKCNITLCAFVRDERMTVYTHPQRLGLVLGVFNS